jgi:CBS domain-containing protein
MPGSVANIITHDVISVAPETGVAQIAALLSKHRISAVPVIDAGGQIIGMVSEGDLLSPFITANQARRSWWLDILAEGETLAPDFVQYISMDHHVARDLMTKKVITATEDMPIAQVADLLIKNHIKRVPIIRDGHVTGIVSRADIVRALCLQ